jgi:hypothetical protein
MKRRGQAGPIYFAALLILNMALGGAIAAARNADEKGIPVFDPVSFQRLVDHINKNDSVAAVTKSGECTPSEGVICSHDTPEKIQVSRVEEQTEQELQKLRSGR